MRNMGEISSRLDTKCLLQREFIDQLVTGLLTVLSLNFAQQQAYRITIVSTAETDLLFDDFARFIYGHIMILDSVVDRYNLA